MSFAIVMLVIISACALFKFEYNYRRYRLSIKLKQKYINWLQNESEATDLPTYQSTILELFKQAKIEDFFLPITQKTGYGVVSTYQCSVFQNMFYRRELIVPHVIDMFDASIGFYRSAFQDAYNPLYWIETVVLLPKSIMEYIGIDMEKSNAKILNVALTSLWWLICVFFTCFKSEIIQLIQTFLEKLAHS